MVINKQMYASVTFFNDKDRTFLTWIAVVLRPMKYDFKEYIFKEGEIANESNYFFLYLYSVFHFQGTSRFHSPQVRDKGL